MKDAPSARDVSIDLLRRYNVPGPRYTSYPTAPVWRNGFGPREYESVLARSRDNEPLAPHSLYVHIPFCERLCYFCACTVVITGGGHSVEGPYLATLEKEIDWVAGRAGAGRVVTQLHWGGGTPTYLPPEAAKRLAGKLRRSFSFAPDAEASVEVDPRVTTRELVETARELGFGGINVDLIFGLPHQTPASFSTTIDRVLEIAPDRLAVYSYANVPWMKKHQRLLEKSLPDESTKFAVFRTALERLTDAGYEYIGMDHFARPDDELSRARRDRTLHRNFQGYTTKAGTDLIGLGMSAIGAIGDAFVQNRRELAAYRDAVDAHGTATFRGFRLSADDRVRRAVISSLLCHAVVVVPEIEETFGIDFRAYFGDALAALEPCEADGLVEISQREIRATPLGRVFLRNLAMPFDAYLPAQRETPVFSRTL